MFLKNKWKNLSIKKKLFLWSSLTIIIAFSLLYISMYLFMPKVYEFYKVNNINEEIKELKYELLNNEEIDIDEVLDKFSYENNLDILLVKKDGNNLSLAKRVKIQTILVEAMDILRRPVDLALFLDKIYFDIKKLLNL